MQYYTRLQESPIIATVAMLQVNPRNRVEVIPMEDRYGRTVTVRTVSSDKAEGTDSVYICAGDNAVYIANVIALAHAHNLRIEMRSASNSGDGI